MTTELEGRLQTMCNWSEVIMERSMEEGMKIGIEKGMEKERRDAIKRMINAGFTKEQILLCSYTEEEFLKVVMKETTDKKHKIYRVNPSCPNCGEEHTYYDIMLSEEEQKILDNYYADHQGESSLALLLSNPPLRIEKSFKCPICKTVFSKNMGIYRENAIDYKSDDHIPVGQVPVF